MAKVEGMPALTICRVLFRRRAKTRKAGEGARSTQHKAENKYPKIAGTASPFGSGDLKTQASPRSPRDFRVGIS